MYIDGEMREQEMIDAARANGDKYEAIGYRYVPSRDWAPGAALAPSRVWAPDDYGEYRPTDEAQDGVCCHASLGGAYHYARYSRGYIVLVGGDRGSTRDDSDIAGEVLIGNPDAVPELLEALKRLVSLQYDGPVYPSAKDRIAGWDKAKAAIAKATGREG